MRKIFNVLIGFFLILLLVVLGIHFSIRKMVIDTLNDNLVTDEVSSVVLDVIIDEYPDIDVEDLSKIESIIEGSEEVRDIGSKYFDSVMDSISSSDVVIPSISSNLDELIENHRKELEEVGIDSSDIEIIKEKLRVDDTIDQVYENVVEDVMKNLTDEQKEVVSFYRIFTSDGVRYGLLIGGFLLIVFVFLINKSLKGGFLVCGISFLVSGLFEFLLIGSIRFLSSSVTNAVLGRVGDISIDSLRCVGIIYLIMGILFFVLSILFRNFKRGN